MSPRSLLPRHGWRVVRLSILAGAVLAAAGGARAQTGSTVACGKCHGNAAFLEGGARSPALATALLVPDSILQDTRHENLACTACHAAFGDGYPHRAPAKAVPCQSCHAAAGEDWARSIHSKPDDGDTPTCVSCHSAHTVYGTADRRSPTHALNVAELCGKCHADEHIIGTYFSGLVGSEARTAVERYHTTVHGQALTRAGLTISATCNDCHEAHKVLPADSAESSVNRVNVAKTCGSCHLGILEVYAGSSHGTAYESGRRTRDGHEAPVCIDCHTSHEVVRADQPDWFLGISAKCGTCHEKLWETYLDTYHGKVTNLGFGLTAKCSDCHTPHRNLPASDTASSVFPTNLAATCARCHAKAGPGFIGYYAHGDKHDRNRYPGLYWTWLGMTALLIGVFSFFGLHTVLWLARLGIDRARGVGRTEPVPGADAVARPISASHRGAGPFIRRFSLLERTLHGFVIVSFLGLVVTGIPLHFSSAPWARGMMQAMGGFQAAGLIHRFCGLLTFGYFFTHVGTLVARVYRSGDWRGLFWGPNSMMPQPKDVRDAAQMFGWFLGLRPRPRFDRFSYMEKFDYLAVFWGVAIIGISGLLLWFPEFFSRFLPGWAFNVATIVHGDEALLAFGFIFTIHFFIVHLRPEKFPIDVVIFTGSATAQYMEEEHPLEYERLEAEGRLAALEVEPPSRALYGWSVALGFLSLALGIGVILLVVWSMLQ